eukprot:scaffold377234_cov56-Prasinocladus_malaysianus.AAC.1
MQYNMIIFVPCASLSCIRPWLLSFSNLCPLCRQPIGGRTCVAEQLNLSQMPTSNRLHRPLSAVRDTERSGPRRSRDDAASAPAWVTLLGSFTVTDFIRNTLAMGRYNEPVEEVDSRASEPGEQEVDDEQQRLRERINEMCRQTVGSKSKQVKTQHLMGITPCDKVECRVYFIALVPK